MTEPDYEIIIHSRGEMPERMNRCSLIELGKYIKTTPQYKQAQEWLAGRKGEIKPSIMMNDDYSALGGLGIRVFLT